jgi:uncharacterized protein DUF5753
VFEPATIPGLLQTAEYARARFAEGVLLFGTPNDVDYAVRTRMQRQELLYRRDKSFHFVLTEGALRYRRSSLEIQLAQLDRLMSENRPGAAVAAGRRGTAADPGPGR